MKQTIVNKDAIETTGLGRRYGSSWALQDCTIRIPQGALSALVGPNGAGKTTLLKLLVGLSKPSSGTSSVLGQIPSIEADYISEVGYLAQDLPLYRQLTVQDHLSMGAHLNKRWNREPAITRLHSLGIPFDRLVSKLSGGQRAQVGLALALAKQPKVLLLDEPVAALDPLARDDFLSSLMQAVADADGQLTVMMSSHLLGDLEKVCDHLVVLANGKTQLCEDIDQVLASHSLLIGPAENSTTSHDYEVIQETKTTHQANLLVRLKQPGLQPAGWKIQRVTTEEIVLAYMKQARTEGGEL